MDIDALQAFVAVANAESFSRAAERLYLSQPAVSKRIAGLESELGTHLFDRIGRRVRLTEAGRTLLPRAGDLLQEVADIKRRITNLSGEVAGTLSMGTSHHIGLRRLPPVLRRYSTDHPDVRLDIQFMDSEVVCQQVERGDLEFGVVTLPPAPPETLELTPLWSDPLDVVVGRDHPLAEKRHISIAKLLEHTAVLPASDTYTRAFLLEALGTQAESLRVGMSTNFLETLKMLASTGLGWTLLPRTMQDDDLIPIAVRGLALRRTLGVVTHRGRTLSNAARAMIHACETSALENG